MATHLASVYDGSLLPSTRPPLLRTHSTPLSLGSLGPSPSGLSPNGSTLHGTSSSGSLPSGSTPVSSASNGSTPFTTSFHNSPFAPLTINIYIGRDAQADQY
ncbi:hypothetical protein G6F56_014487 [Rhizopus delemar]|nr:hypothetical protein G6F56_014487 [Rhizopus delemar]